MSGRRWFPLLVSTMAVAVSATHAAAAEPDPGGSSFCSPACPKGQTCVGRTCMVPAPRPAPPPPAAPPPAAPPQAAPPPAPPPQAAPPQAAPSQAAPSQAAPSQAAPSQAAPPPAYPPPAYAPPPGSSPNAAPPPAYPPPAYAPPPGYAQPQPGYAPPPPGYYYPPPGYAPPKPGYYYQPQPAIGYAPPPKRKRGFLALPYLGLHSYQNDAARGYDPGARLGTFLGGRVNETLSINSELTLDISNRNDVPSTTSYSEFGFNLAFSPMVHLPAGTAEIVLGPKLGLFVIATEASNGITSVSQTITGIVAGFNFGFFFPVSPTASLGLLFSFAIEEPEEACITVTGQSEMCDSNLSADSAKILGLTGAALF